MMRLGPWACPRAWPGVTAERRLTRNAGGRNKKSGVATWLCVDAGLRGGAGRPDGGVALATRGGGVRLARAHLLCGCRGRSPRGATLLVARAREQHQHAHAHAHAVLVLVLVQAARRDLRARARGAGASLGAGARVPVARADVLCRGRCETRHSFEPMAASGPQRAARKRLTAPHGPRKPCASDSAFCYLRAMELVDAI